MATPKKRKPKTAGRKTRYRPENVSIAGGLIAGGMTQEQAAAAMGVSTGTWQNWRVRYPEFLRAITDTDEEMVRLAEKSLLKRVTGYEWNETQTLYEDDGKRVKKGKKITVRNQAPSDTAIMFCLTNRKPERWKRIPVESDSEIGAPVIPINVEVRPAVSDVKVTVGSVENDEK